MFFKLERVVESPERLLKQRLGASRLEFLVQGGCGQGLRICISNKFPGDADAAGPGSPLSEILP